MTIIDKIVLWFKGSSKTEYMLSIAALQQIEDDCKVAIKSINDRSLDWYGILGYLRHLPIKGKSNGWPNRIYQKSNKCLSQLYQYALKQGYIEKETTFEEFIEIKS